MKLASLLNNFLLCCTYHLLSECRQWSKNRSERRQFCVLLGQTQSGGRKSGRQSFPISMEANGKQFHRSPRCYGIVRDLSIALFFCARKLCFRPLVSKAGRESAQEEMKWRTFASFGTCSNPSVTFPGLPMYGDPSSGWINLPTHLQPQT